MSNPQFDAIVIGGGPGGSSASTFLARAGKRVLLLEKEFFPRFHIGESLLPYNQALFREMGLLPALEAAGFPRKFGAQFLLGNGTRSTLFVFADGRFAQESETFQVERSIFDHILLKHARASGADAREGWTVQKFSTNANGVTVDACGPDGKTEQFSARFLIDASGRGNVTGNQEGLRVMHEHHKKIAVFGHFLGVKRDGGERGGDTLIVRLENKWFWLIPISAEKTSVGLVLSKDEFAQWKGSPQELFEHWIEYSAVMKDRMAEVSRVGPMHTTTDFSYYNRRLVGQRLLRVGDAAGFMDPIFSAGVFLAMWSGKLAAKVVEESLQNGHDGARLLRPYEKRVARALRFYWTLVENYYTTPFMELFLFPRNHADLPAAVTAVLAGELDATWSVRWRLKYFFLLVKLQKFCPIVPRISFVPRQRAAPASRQPLSKV